MPVVFAIRIFGIGLYNASYYATIITPGSTALSHVSLAERSVLIRIKGHDILFNALLVNVSVPPWIVTDTLSLAGQSGAVPLVSVLVPM